MIRCVSLCLCCIVSVGCASTTQNLKGLPAPQPISDRQKISAVFSTPKRIAILVGINHFDDSRWGKLRYAAKDANDLSAVLNDTRYGNFDDVITLTDPDNTSKRAILNSVSRLALRNLSTDDTVVFFISSHGTLARPSDGKIHQYIVVRDTSFDDIPGTAIDLTELKRSIGALKSEKKVMILAFCHSGQGKSRLSEGILTELGGIKAPFFVKPLEEAS